MSLMPLMRKDLVLLARRRWWFFARGGILASMLVVSMWQLSKVVERMSYGQPAVHIARDAFEVFALVQLILMALAAPAFGTGALEEARATGTMDLLRLAAISRMRLALVKLLAATAWPLLLALSLAPFMALWALWGGVTGEELVGAVLLIAATGVLLSAIGLASRSLTSSTNLALGLAYGLTVAIMLAPPLLAELININRFTLATFHAPAAVMLIGPYLQNGNEFWVPVLTALALTLGCGLVAGWALRFRESKVVAKLQEAGFANARALGRPSRKVWNASLLWKEVRSAGGKGRLWMTRVAWGLTLALLMVTHFASDRDWRVVSFLLAWPLVPAVLLAVLSAAAVSSEKEKGTLGPLLLAPHGAQRIIMTKLAGIFGRAAPCILFPLVYAPMLAELIGRADLKFLYWFVPVVFLFSSFGITCSVLLRRTAVAVAVTFAGCLLQLFAFMWLSDELPGLRGDEEMYAFVVMITGMQIFWLILAVSSLEAVARRRL